MQRITLILILFAALVTKQVIDCPQCRKSIFIKDKNIEVFPKNTILANILNSIRNSTKAICPECKNINELIVCDHCSEISCLECNNVSFKQLSENII